MTETPSFTAEVDRVGGADLRSLGLTRVTDLGGGYRGWQRHLDADRPTRPTLPIAAV